MAEPDGDPNRKTRPAKIVSPRSHAQVTHALFEGFDNCATHAVKWGAPPPNESEWGQRVGVMDEEFWGSFTIGAMILQLKLQSSLSDSKFFLQLSPTCESFYYTHPPNCFHHSPL